MTTLLLTVAALAAGEPPAPPPLTSLSDPKVKYEVPKKPYVVLKHGNLEAVIVDNRAVDDDVLKKHRAGYSGVAELRHTEQPRNVFVPGIAGLNFEHIHDGTKRENDVLYEPRRAAMELRVIDARTAELYQPPTPNWHLESCARYRLLDGDLIEMTFECVPRKPVFKNGYVGLFWASYMDQPDSNDIFFRGSDDGGKTTKWVTGHTPKHGVDATHLAVGDTREWKHDADFPMTLVFNRSKLRYAEPWYVGKSRGMAAAMLFRPADGILFAQSPSGGGGNDRPAWDFQWFLDDYEVDRRYQMVMRLLYTPTKADVSKPPAADDPLTKTITAARFR